MIVLYKDGCWQITTQRAHGLLAAQLAFYWKEKDRPERWVEMLLAIAEHDDAENELDGENLLTENGGPLNFDLKNFEAAHCTKLSSLSVTKSRFIALLTSMHMSFLYEKDKKKDNEAKTFLDEQKKKQAQWRKELGLSKEEALRCYNLLEWCDALSLLICKEDMQPEQRSIEISTGPDDKSYELIQLNEETLTINPWPFQSKTFSVQYEYRLLDTLQFASSAALRIALLQVEVKEKKWNLRQAPLRRTTENKKVKIKG